jgi:hypothetical protein
LRDSYFFDTEVFLAVKYRRLHLFDQRLTLLLRIDKYF